MKNLYILGHPVAHSKSPVMYNAVYKKLGLDWRYDFMDLPTSEEAEAFLDAGAYLSVNITTPYKPEAYAAAKVKASSAQLAHGVNLLANKDGNLIGFNVDGQGAVRFLEREGIDFAEKKVVVCGTGPTSLAIVHACALAGAAEVLMVGRDKQRARAVMERYVEDYRHLASTAIAMPSAEDNHLSFADAYEHATFKFGSYTTSTKAIAAADVIVDATVLGMNEGDPAPFDTALLSSRQVVMDTVYGHGTSALLAAAKQAGCRAYDGAGMLVSQAALTVITLCEVEGVDIASLGAEVSYDSLFDIMAQAAEFEV